MNDIIDDILFNRRSFYGDFEDVAAVTMHLFINYCKGHQRYVIERNTLATTMFMICNKVARLVCGSVYHRDSWIDIAGYAKLVLDEERIEISLENNLFINTLHGKGIFERFIKKSNTEIKVAIMTVIIRTGECAFEEVQKMAIKFIEEQIV